METGIYFLKYLEQQTEFPIGNKAQILMLGTPCAAVLWDTFDMFGQGRLKQDVLFCNEPWGESLELKLGVKELQDLVHQTLALDEDFMEGDYMKYIIRKIFARYQEEGKINLSICYK